LEQHEQNSAQAALFRTTHWSVVLAAGGQSSTAAREALESLCRTYWYPLYAFVRRQGYGPDDAQDLTQEFFARLIEKDRLAEVRPERGRFRSFLRVSLKHFLADARDWARAQKRGGGRPPISLNDSEAESRYQHEPQDDLSPDRIFERRWAYALLEAVMDRLQKEFQSAGKPGLFEALKPFLAGDIEGRSYAEAGARFGLSEGAAKMTVTRMRRRYKHLLREEVANTVASPADVEEELGYLLAVLRG
jgi:RNA polymerase sigma-70 factor (ECF subfamily)